MLDFTPKSSLFSSDLIQVEVIAGTKLRELAKLIEMEELELLKLNKQFKKGIVPKAKAHYNINIPYEKIVMFHLHYDEPMEDISSLSPYLLSHYVALGETLDSIAKEYNSSAEAIQRANYFESEFIELDRLLVVPVSEVIFQNSSK